MPDAPDPTPRRLSVNAVVAPATDVKLLTFGETAYVLRVSVTTVRRLVESGQLRQTRVMGRTFVARVAIDDFLRAAEVSRRPAAEVDAVLAAQKKLEAEQRMRAQVKAEWSKGEKQIDLDKARARLADRAARKKAKSA